MNRFEGDKTVLTIEIARINARIASLRHSGYNNTDLSQGVRNGFFDRAAELEVVRDDLTYLLEHVELSQIALEGE